MSELCSPSWCPGQAVGWELTVTWTVLDARPLVTCYCIALECDLQLVALCPFSTAGQEQVEVSGSLCRHCKESALHRQAKHGVAVASARSG